MNQLRRSILKQVQREDGVHYPKSGSGPHFEEQMTMVRDGLIEIVTRKNVDYLALTSKGVLALDLALAIEKAIFPIDEAEHFLRQARLMFEIQEPRRAQAYIIQAFQALVAPEGTGNRFPVELPR